MVLILIIYLFAYFLLAITRLDWAVMFLIAALPAYLIRFNILGMPVTLLEAMILIAFSAWLLDNYKKIIKNIKLRIKVPSSKFQVPSFIRYPFDIEIILLLVVSFIAAGVAGFSASAMGIWKAYFFEPALVFILTFNVFKHNANDANDMRMTRIGFNIEKILWPLAVSAFAVSIFAIYQKFTGAFIFNELWAAEETRRVTSFFGYPNAAGLYLGPLSLLLTGWALGQIKDFKNRNSKFQIPNPKQIQNPKSKILKIIFTFVVILISLLSIYFAKSEGAMIGIAAGLIMFGLLAGKKIRWAAVILIFIAGMGIITFHPIIRDYAVKKITLTDLSGEIRKQQWRETWEMFAASPLRFALGAGLANYKNAVAPYHQEGIFFNRDNDPEFYRHVVWDAEYKKSHWQPTEIYLYPHNIILNFWSELGLAGLLLFIWIIGKFFVIGIWDLFGNWKLEIGNLETRKNKYLALGLLSAMTVIIIHGLVDVPYFKNDLAAMFWLFIAMMSFINLEKAIWWDGRAACPAEKRRGD